MWGRVELRQLVWLVFALFGLFVGRGGSVAQTPAPSFGCHGNASPAEGAICSDPKLAAEDRFMARLYALSQVSAFGSGRSNEFAAQREWLRSRDYACRNADPTCLVGMYQDRNERLAIAVLFSHPEVALPEIRRVDPDAAGLLQAIYLYARSGKLSEADRQRIARLLEPFAGPPGGVGSFDPVLAVKSDSAFAEFIGTRSAFLAGNSARQYAPVFPCAAMVRKPKLVGATAPRFGSTMDSFIIYSDCEDTLPPLPKLSALVGRGMTGMHDAECGGGTIRFGDYRAFANDAVAAQLATGSQLRNQRSKPFPHPRSVNSADISAAVNELTAYYVHYGRAGRSQARPLAQQMIFTMLNEAMECERP
jgi:hypothetical protein